MVDGTELSMFYIERLPTTGVTGQSQSPNPKPGRTLELELIMPMPRPD